MKSKGEAAEIVKRIYEDNANGKLSDSRFQMLSNDCEQEQEDVGILHASLLNDLQNGEKA